MSSDRSPMIVEPRALVHRGVVDAAAWLVPFVRGDESRARADVLASLGPSDRVLRIESSFLVLAPARIDTRASSRVPLVSHRGSLLAAPLDDRELADLGLIAPSLVLVVAGEAQVIALSSLSEEDPSTWFDLGRLEVRHAASLGAPPPTLALPVKPADVTSSFAAWIRPSPEERSQVADALAKARSASRLSWLASLWIAVSSMFSGGGRRPTVSPQEAPPGLSPYDRLRSRLADLFARLLLLSRLARYIERAHAKYLAKMLEFFDRGDLDQALRHAIPLGSDGKVMGSAMPAFRLPGPRAGFSIRPHGPGLFSSLGLGGSLYDHLRRLYRAAFEKLDAAGDVEKAAFVLAELLRANEEAVAYLERHDRLQLAAEVAEARKMPPGLIVRQWMRAGNVERAIALARIHRAFADAVTRLHEKHRDEADALRIAWADHAASSGDFRLAVLVLGPVAAARAMRLAFLEKGIERGGVPAAELLAERLDLDPTRDDDTLARGLALLDDETSEGAEERAEFAHALVPRTSRTAREPLLRAAGRAVVRDRADGYSSAIDLTKFLRDHPDAALRADRPDVAPLRAHVSLTPLAFTHRVDASETGPCAIFDVAELPRGRLLVALGELGAAILAPDGALLHRFDEPAFSLVVADAGDRALALAPRGEAQRIARLDLASRRSEHWVEAQVATFARTFDGEGWLVAVLRGRKPHLAVVDCLSPGFTALTSIDIGDVAPTSLARRGGTGVALFDAKEALVMSEFEDRTLAMRSSPMIRAGSGFGLPVALAPNGDVVCVDAETSRVLVNPRNGKPSVLSTDEAPPARLVLGEQMLVTVGDREIGRVVRLRARGPIEHVADIALEGADSVAIWLSSASPRAIVADDRGRLVVVDIARGFVTRPRFDLARARRPAAPH